MSIISPSYLPQISIPIDMVIKKLKEENVDYEYLRVNPNDLNPSQVFTLSDEVEDVIIDDKYPIWIDQENNIIDGHKRMVFALLDNLQLTAIKLKTNFKNGCRVLNKIQDIYEYEQAQGIEEVVNNDVNNEFNRIDSGVSDSEFLASLEEDNATVQAEKPSANQKTLIGYRKEPIKENSVVGNFFTLNPIDGFNKYQIDFDNLLDTNALGVTYKDSQQPLDILSKIWFPHINFEKLSEQYNTTSDNLKNKAIAKKAMKMGYDGIKYGDTLIQGLK